MKNPFRKEAIQRYSYNILPFEHILGTFYTLCHLSHSHETIPLSRQLSLLHICPVIHVRGRVRYYGQVFM